MLQDIEHMRAADALRVVDAGIVVAARFQVPDAGIGMGDHVPLVPKTMAWVGQALAQAGPCPTATRSEHSVHL